MFTVKHKGMMGFVPVAVLLLGGALPGAEPDPAPGWQVRHTISDQDAVGIPVFSGDGKMVAVADRAANSIRFRDVETGKLHRTLEIKGMGIASDFSLSANGDTVAVLGATFHGYFRYNRLKVLDVRSGEELLDVATYGHLVVLSPDGQLVAWTGDFDHSLTMWDRRTNKTQPLPTPDHWPTCLTFSPDGKTLAVPVGHKIHLIDTATGKELPSLTGKFYIDAVVFASDGKSLAVAGVEWTPNTNAREVQGRALQLDFKTGQVIGDFTAKTSTPNRGDHTLRGSQGGNLWTFSTASQRTVFVWQPATGKEESILTGKQFGPASISPDGKTIAAVHDGGNGKTVFTLLQRK
jgi:WD40 repeat protein